MTDVPTKNDKPNLSAVRKLPPPMTDIAANLRMIADWIEAGRYPQANAFLGTLTFGEQEAELELFALGHLGDSYRASGIAMRAAIRLSNHLEPAEDA